MRLYGLDNLETPVVEKEERGISSFEFTGLKPATEYKLYVEAYDEAGNCVRYPEDNGYETATTAEEKDTEAPQPLYGTISVDDVSPNSITLSWQAATDNKTASSDILYSIKMYKGMSGPSSDWVELVSENGITSYTAENLDPNTIYSFMVTAKDKSNNEVDYNVMVIKTTEEKDTEAPRVSAKAISMTDNTPNSITLSWQAATDNKTDPLNIVYTIKMKKIVDGTSGSWAELESKEGITSYTAENLAPDTSYLFMVTAKDASGNETDYESVVYKTLEEKDIEAPQVSAKAIRMADTTSNSITIAWQAAKDNKTDSQNIVYTIKMKKIVSGTSSDWVEIESKRGIDSYTAKDLAPATFYSFMVSAKDESGNQIDYNSVDVQTAEERDTEAPQVFSKEIRCKDRTPISTFIEWDPATDNKTAQSEIEYSVYKSRIVPGEEEKIELFIDRKKGITSCEVTGLDFLSADYRFYVKAYDSAGNCIEYESKEVFGLELSDCFDIELSSPDIRCTKQTPNSITIEWEPVICKPGWEPSVWEPSPDIKAAMSEVEYCVYKTKVSSSGEKGKEELFIEHLKDTSCEVTGLEPSTQYCFYVEPVAFEVGYQEYKTSECFSTLEEKDTEAPQVSSNEITASNITANSITLSWRAAKDNKTAPSEILYEVYVNKGTSSGGGEKKYSSKGITTCMLTDLEPNTQYCFTVVAKDASGNETEYNSAVFRTAEGKDIESPQVSSRDIRATIASKSITLSWQAATDNKTESAEILYEVYVNKGTSGRGERKYFSKGITKCILPGLEPNTQYRFTVVAKDTSGNEMEYNSAVFRTADGKDTESPQVTSRDIRATNIASKSITLSWQAATDNKTESAEILYEVYVNKGTSGRGERKYSSRGVTTCVLPGLEPNTQYCFTVVAKDMSGNETVYNSAVFRTAEEKDMIAPVVSSNVINATNITTNSITLSWHAATDNKTSSTEILYYVYQGTTCIKSARGITSHVVTGLSPKTRYSFYVEARDNSGNVTRYVTKVVETKDTEAPIATDALPYNPTNLRIVKETNDWLLTDGRSRMLIFATEEDAMNGLKVVKRHTRQCFIGRSNKRSNRKDFIFEYWEGNSGLPVEKLSKSDIIPYDPKKVSARFNAKAGYWEIIEEISGSFTHGMFIADNEADAKAMLSVIKRYSKLCFIGRDNKKSNRKDYIMQYFE